MANTIGYGQGAVNNTNGWGKSATNNTIDFGEVCADSWSPETNLVGGSSFSNTYSTQYDGIDAYISTDATYSELDGQNKMTLSLWIKPSTSGVSEILTSTIRNATVSNYQHLVMRDIYDRIRFFKLSGVDYTYSNTNVINVGQWNHIMVCVDLSQPSTSTRGRIFVNNVDETSGTVNLNNTPFDVSIDSLYIGENQNGYLKPFDGNIDEVAIWSGTDLRNDVATIYNSGVPGNLNDNGLTAPTSWYRFEEGNGTTIADSGSSTNNATIQNSVTFETDVPT